MTDILIKEIILNCINDAYPKALSIGTISEQSLLDEETVYNSIKALIDEQMPLELTDEVVLLKNPVLSGKRIKDHLSTETFGQSIQLFQTLPSTNTYTKQNIASLSEGTLVLAHAQSLGKGRLGRNWASPAGKTISMSLLLKPVDQKLNYSIITQMAAASFVQALSLYTNEAQIKWPNDIVVNKKKVAGILTEAEYSGSTLEGIIIGMGVNTNLDEADIPADLKEKAASLKSSCGIVDPNILLIEFLNQFEQYYYDWLTSQTTQPFLSVCRDRSALIGREFWIITNSLKNESKRKARIDTINDSGSLIVTYLDTFEKSELTSTHYSIRGTSGYL